MGDISNVQQADFALVPVLQKLHGDSSTGRLQVRPQQGSYGTIYFEQGQIVHAAHGIIQGIEAFVTIVAWNVAQHSFRPNIPSKDYTISLSFSDLLQVLSQSEQALKQSFGAAPTASAVGTEAALTKTQTLGNGDPVSRDFMDELAKLFVDVKGPIASIIMEDASYDLGYELTELPKSELKAFYKSLVKEIPDVDDQRWFVASLRLLEARY